MQLCRDKVLPCHDKDYYVVTNHQYVATLALEISEKPKNCRVRLFSSSFHPRTINNSFFGFLGQREGGRTPLMGFLSLNYQFS